MPRNGSLQQPIFTEDGVAGGAIIPGTGIIRTTNTNADKDTVIAATSGFIDGIASGIPVGGGTVTNYASGDTIKWWKVGSEALVLLTGAVTDLTIPLKISGNGYTPVTTTLDIYNCMPLELGAIGQYIAVYVCNGYVAK